jgi:thioredoxin-dependent peroxiredoxin
MRITISLLALGLLASCSSTPSAAVVAKPAIAVASSSAKPGCPISRKGLPVELLPGELKIGQSLSSDGLRGPDLKPWKSGFAGKPSLICVAPSLDTGVCQAQAEGLAKAVLPEGCIRFFVSRDLPFAQKRALEALKLSGVSTLSDYDSGAWTQSLGLLQGDNHLAARAVIVTDAAGKVVWFQICPELAHLPDLEKAAAELKKLTEKH